jgi:hypothetical protein
MKDIKDMNLAECIEALRDVEVITRGYQCNYDAIEELADRIHDLTRWNNIDDSLPPKGALFETCGVESGTYWRYYTAPPSLEVDRLSVPEDKP